MPNALDNTLRHEEIIEEGIQNAITEAGYKFDDCIENFERVKILLEIDEAFDAALDEYVYENSVIYSDNNENEIDALLDLCKSTFAQIAEDAFHEALSEALTICRENFIDAIDGSISLEDLKSQFYR